MVRYRKGAENTMRLGINATPPHTSAEEWANYLAKRGCRATAFPLNFSAPVNRIDEYVKAAKERDILIAEVGVWNSPHVPDKETAAHARMVAEEQLRLAEYVGARCCVNVSGAAGPDWAFCYKENFSEWLYDENVRFIQLLCDRVKPKKTRFTLEPMQWMVPASPQEYVKILKDVDREGFAVHMDAINFIKDPYTYTHKRELLDETFELLGSQTRSCHLKDCILKPGTTVAIKEVPLGEGTMEIPYYLEKIAQLDDDMPVLLEHLPDMAAYDRAIDWLKRNDLWE